VRKKSAFETSSFKKLQAKWYSKLKETTFSDGEQFVDIENGSDDTVVHPEIITTRPVQYNSGEDYFELCQKILNTFKFKKPIHKTIFELHTKSKSEREIVAALRSDYDIKVTQQGVNLIINRVKTEYQRDYP